MGYDLAPVSSVVKGIAIPYIKFPKIWVDNYVFRLHCKFTPLLLFLSCTLVSLGMYWGDPIDCIVEGVPGDVMDTYCWLHSTFTLPREGMVIMEDDPHPGVGPVFDRDPVQHRYYQWVGFTLLLQGLLFLVPYNLWKKLEGGRVDSLIPKVLVHHHSDGDDKKKIEQTDTRMPGFATDVFFIEETEKREALKEMMDYFLKKRSNAYIRTNRHYMIKFAICEFLNFVNVFGQIYFLNVFFGGYFTSYGTNVFSQSQEDPEQRVDAMNSVFPKVGKCTFSKFGPSGTIQRFDGLCILPLNIFNEKIYILLWLWFVILTVISAFNLVWRMATFLSGRFREMVLRQQATLQATPDEIATVTTGLTHGDWFILLQIGENIDSQIYLELISSLAKSFKKELRNGGKDWISDDEDSTVV